MINERPVLSRSTFLALGLVIFVLACGAGGVLFAKHRSAPGASVRAAGGTTPVTPALGGAEPPPVLAGVAKMPPLRSKPGVPWGTPATPPSPVLPAKAVPALAGELSVRDEKPGEITDDQEVELALHRWQKALLTNDAAEIDPSYAAHVNRYFLQTQVSRAYVHDYMEKEEERGVRLTAYDLQDVTMKHLKPNEVEVDFHADFQVSTPARDRTGSARTVLMLRREEGDWKIFYERDFRS